MGRRAGASGAGFRRSRAGREGRPEVGPRGWHAGGSWGVVPPGNTVGMASYDAFLLVSFGGPEGPGDVIPFLENVTGGRNVPRERLEQVAEHYYRFGGVSPINQQCRDLLAAVEKDFAGAGVDLPVYWGNRNWDPYLTDAV